MSPAAAISVPEAARDGGVRTVGNFDGVHLGHRQMVDQLVALARKLETRAIAVTFDPPPLALLAPGRIPPQLTTRSQKVELLKSIGVDEVVVFEKGAIFFVGLLPIFHHRFGSDSKHIQFVIS